MISFDQINWIDTNAVGRPQRYDDRFEYNPPRVTAPAMEQEQFDYDNQREIEIGLLANPSVAAHQIHGLKIRVQDLENELERRKQDDRYARASRKRGSQSQG